MKTEDKPLNFTQKSWRIYKIATPAMISTIIPRTSSVVNFSLLGHLNDPALIPGMIMGIVVVKLLGGSVLDQMNKSLDTLISQSFGNGKKELCGVHLNRARFLTTCFMVPILAISYFYTESALIFTGQYTEVAKNA